MNSQEGLMRRVQIGSLDGGQQEAGQWEKMAKQDLSVQSLAEDVI